MSSAPYPPAGNQPIPGLDLGPPTRPARRYALGLPRGSVRAILALMVVVLICVLILLSPTKNKPIPIPPYLLYLLFMVLGHLFAVHGHGHGAAAAEPAPLHLPRGFIRLFILAILIRPALRAQTGEKGE